MNSLRMAMDSIREKKGRSFLTMLGIIIGVCAVLVLVAMVEGYNADVTAYYEKMGVNKVEISLEWLDISRAEDYTEQLTVFAQEELATSYTAVSPILTQQNAVASYGDYTAEAVEMTFTNEQYAESGNFIIEDGRDLTTYDMENRNNVCVIGGYVSQTLFGYADPIGEEILVNGNPLTVVGTYYAKDGAAEDSMDNMLIVPYTLSRELAGTSYLTEYWIKIDKSTQMDNAVSTTELWLASSISETVATYEVANGNAAMSESQDEMTSLSLILGGVAGIALLVGGIGIMNIMLVTVSERTREIGIKKAIGAPPSDIISQFLVEAAILSAMGGLIGVLTGYALSAILGQAMFGVISFPAAIITAGAFAFAVIIGIGFGLYPAAKAAGLQPVDALRVD